MQARENNQQENEEVMSALDLLRAQLGDELMSGETLTPALESIYAEMGMSFADVDATVHVSLLDSDGRGNEENVWRGDPEHFDMTIITKKFGSGAYRIKIYAKNSTGKKVKTAEKVSRWKLSAEDEALRKAGPVIASGSPSHAEIAQMIAEAMRPILAVVQHPVNPMANLEQMITIAKLMQPPQQDPIAMLKLGLEMAGAQKQTESAPRDTGSNVNDVLITMVENFASPIATLMANAAKQPGQQLNVVQPPVMIDHNEVQQQPIEHQPESEEEMNLLAMQKLKQGISLLVMQAMAGNPVETYAEMAIDNVPEDALKQVLDQPDPIEWLCTIDPQVSNYKEWFNEWIAEVKRILKESTEQQNS
jgi:hypothetical protein